jgi:hypothetical protein
MLIGETLHGAKKSSETTNLFLLGEKSEEAASFLLLGHPVAWSCAYKPNKKETCAPYSGDELTALRTDE